MNAPGGGAFDHIARLSDHRGLFEHAAGTVRREEHGYCTDDNARLLVVTSREPDTDVTHRLDRVALRFVLDAQAADGRCRNRMDRNGRWTDRAGTNDCWGRSLWGLGTAAAHHADASIRNRALQGFDDGVRQRSRWPRAMAFAALGAAEVLAGDPRHRGARALLADALDVMGTLPNDAWSWPESRLTYANAALAEAVIVGGAALERPADLDRGLTMLAWLLDLETLRGHLSVTGVGGRGRGDEGPRFDQQPIEAAAMADACWRASQVTGDRTWSRGVAAAAGWFAGDNDTGLPMYDDVSGGGFDGLQPEGVNLNQGAESTLALVSTMQRARSFAPAR
ncbi:MAG: glycosyltransferase [Ilumatobacteraceae bacterium]